jgi:hypothetical protein
MTEPSSTQALERTYQNLVNLWTSGVRDYHSLLSDYLTANSIFVAAIGLLLSHQPRTLIFSIVVLVLSIFGIFITLQMAIVLGRFDAQNLLWEWELRGIERASEWKEKKLFSDLYHLRHEKRPLEDPNNDPPTFYPNYAMQLHRRWWAHRALSFPVFFAILYVLFFTWSLTDLLH